MDRSTVGESHGALEKVTEPASVSRAAERITLTDFIEAALLGVKRAGLANIGGIHIYAGPYPPALLTQGQEKLAEPARELGGSTKIGG